MKASGAGSDESPGTMMNESGPKSGTPQDVPHSPGLSVPSSIGSARRRLLRGAFSAPAALALYSGGAIAAASNQLGCVLNQQANPVSPVPPVTLTNETYVRIGLYKRTNNNKYFVRGSELRQLKLALSYTTWPTSNQVRRFNIDNNAFDDDSRSIPSDLESSPTRYAVLRIDGTGTVVGVGKSGVTGGSAIYQSCWTSIIGGF